VQHIDILRHQQAVVAGSPGHQVLAVEMRKAWFPSADALHADPNLQRAYMLLCFCVAILAAMAVTFGIEQPASRWLNRHLGRYMDE